MKRSAMARTSGVISMPGTGRAAVAARRSRACCRRDRPCGPLSQLADRIPPRIRSARPELRFDLELAVVLGGAFAAGGRARLDLSRSGRHHEVSDKCVLGLA